MSVKNFIPKVWSAAIDKQLDEFLVAADFCNRQYEGEVKEAGDQVRVQQAIRPTIIRSSDGKPLDMSTPEDPDGTTLAMDICEQAGFNYSIPNIDEAQAKGNIKSVLTEESTQGMANEIDKFLFGLAAEKAVPKSQTTKISTDNVLNIVNRGFERLWSANVPANTPLEIDISPAFHTIFLEAYSKLDTNNSEMLKNGVVGRYSNATVKMTNNLHNDGTDDYIVIRTNKAMAFAKPLTTIEALKNPKRLGDIARGAVLFGGKVTRPREMYVIKAHYA